MIGMLSLSSTDSRRNKLVYLLSTDQQAFALGPLMGLFDPALQAWWGTVVRSSSLCLKQPLILKVLTYLRQIYGLGTRRGDKTRIVALANVGCSSGLSATARSQTSR
jgi:hypothetical protein